MLRKTELYAEVIKILEDKLNAKTQKRTQARLVVSAHYGARVSYGFIFLGCFALGCYLFSCMFNSQMEKPLCRDIFKDYQLHYNDNDYLTKSIALYFTEFTVVLFIAGIGMLRLLNAIYREERINCLPGFTPTFFQTRDFLKQDIDLSFADLAIGEQQKVIRLFENFGGTISSKSLLKDLRHQLCAGLLVAKSPDEETGLIRPMPGYSSINSD